MNDFQYLKGATPLDPDEMEGLKIRHITVREQLNRFEQDNIADSRSSAHLAAGCALLDCA